MGCDKCGAPKKDTDWYINKNNGSKLPGKCLRCGNSLTVELFNNQPTIQEIKDLSMRARNKFERPGGNCLKISTYILSALHERGVPSKVEETKVNGSMHYQVILIINNNKIKLDASRDQFNGCNRKVIVEYIN